MYAMQVLPEQRLFTVHDLARMVEAGVIDEDEHVELLDGVLLTVGQQGPEHSALTVHLRRRLERLLGERAHLRDHSSLRLDDLNLPEPDIAVVRGGELEYLARLPSGDDVLLVVEIAVTSQRRDRRKAFVYARSGIPEYWILDVPARTLTVHRDPAVDGYGIVEMLRESENVEVPGTTQRWRIDEFLP